MIKHQFWKTGIFILVQKVLLSLALVFALVACGNTETTGMPSIQLEPKQETVSAQTSVVEKRVTSDDAAIQEDSIDRKTDEKTSFSETEQSEIPENTLKGEEQSKTGENEGGITVEKALVLSIDGQEIPVSWEDNDSVMEIMEQSLKDTILVDMHQYGGWEQVGSLGRAYSRNDTQITAQNGDIVLYSGNQIVLFYGSNSWAYTKLGHIMLSEEDITALLNKNSVSLTIEMK